MSGLDQLRVTGAGQHHAIDLLVLSRHSIRMLPMSCAAASGCSARARFSGHIFQAQEVPMALITIKDLPQSIELDRKARQWVARAPAFGLPVSKLRRFAAAASSTIRPVSTATG